MNNIIWAEERFRKPVYRAGDLVMSKVELVNEIVFHHTYDKGFDQEFIDIMRRRYMKWEAKDLVQEYKTCLKEKV